MRLERFHGGVVVSLVAALGLMAAGCAKEEKKADQTKGKPPEVADKGKGHDHSGWWCDEHGVPEEICGQGNAKLAAQFKKKGDWCKEHDRPDSQCFIHHPEPKEKFAAQYRAKFGKEPPPMEEEKKDEPKKDDPKGDQGRP